MARTAQKLKRRRKIHRSIRRKISGTALRPRLCVFRSNKEIYAQIIDDVKGHTICSTSSRDASCSASGNKTEQAKAVGARIAELAKENDIKSIVFDRNGYIYHGRVKALGDAARESGLNF